MEVASESIVDSVFCVNTDAGCEPVDTVWRNPLLGVVLRSSSGNAPGMVDKSDWPYAGSLRGLAPDFALFFPGARGLLPALFPLSPVLLLASSALLCMLPPLPDLRISGLSAVSGGLGGVSTGGGFAGIELLLPSASSVISDAAGVNDFTFRTSSILPTASLLCALLNVGYDILGLTSLPVPLRGRRSISGARVSIFVLLDVLSDIVDRGNSLSRSLSLLRDLRFGSFVVEVDLYDERIFSRELAGSRSRSDSSLRRRLLGSSSRVVMF